MQKYGFSMTNQGTMAVPSDVGGFYLAADVDARIAELELRISDLEQEKIDAYSEGYSDGLEG